MITASGSYRSSAFHDKDGSVGGVPNSYIVINGGIAPDEACEDEAHLERAYVCKGDVGPGLILAPAARWTWRCSWRCSWRCACWRSRAVRTGGAAGGREGLRADLAHKLLPRVRL